MEFEDICWLEGVFEKLLMDAKKARDKRAILNLIRLRWQEIKHQKLGFIEATLSC